MKEIILEYSRYFHIAGGIVALVVAPLAMIVSKGGRYHRIWGKAYFWAMTSAIISAIIISAIKPIPFLLMVAVFSYYFVVSGYRALYHKRLYKGENLPVIDWIIAGLSGLFSLGLIIWAIIAFISGLKDPMLYVAMAFGIIGILVVVSDIRTFIKKPKEKTYWFIKHMSGMLGGYIATVSAFSAVNFNFLPTIIQWLWPTVIGVPLLIYWTGIYQKKFNKGTRVKELATVEINTDPTVND